MTEIIADAIMRSALQTGDRVLGFRGFCRLLRGGGEHYLLEYLWPLSIF